MKQTDKKKLIKVGEFSDKFNNLISANIPLLKIYCSKGLRTHLIKREHYSCLPYINAIPDIIENPDYIGINPNENETTIELIKVYNKNILIGIKLDADENYLYVSTMYELQESKLIRRLHSGRLKIYIDE
ncbi:MAG: hypothetical protein EWM47_05835 [Anaerolineaceae bacterium]|nr:MAG: hypothetical protein EWM47_05835 [Anaerolineaceae bacterium]